jgi:hypothetical protein
MEAIRREQNKRWLQYMKGEREYDTVYKPLPKPHAYFEPHHIPRWEL